jgi:hypothetical protein
MPSRILLKKGRIAMLTTRMTLKISMIAKVVRARTMRLIAIPTWLSSFV